MDQKSQRYKRNPTHKGDTMIEAIRKFERVIFISLLVMMSLVVMLATIELGWIIIKDIITPPIFLLEINELFEIFGLFMLVLIGLELLETIAKTYSSDKVNHAQIVMAVAIIAISRKVIILDVEKYSGQALMGIAAIILALSLGYFLVQQKSGTKRLSETEKE
jgi:uncharacterized membrane protein (DUF373 family)